MGDTAVKSAAVDRTAPVLEPGAHVEVRRRFDRSWARGFEVAEVVDGGYRVRRRSDGFVLPVSFGFDEVREPDIRQPFWGGGAPVGASEPV